jgi:acetamidase/formamidase
MGGQQSATVDPCACKVHIAVVYATSQESPQMTKHELLPCAGTVHWGYFDGSLAPVLTIAPGDTVTIHSVSGGPEDLPPAGAKMTIRPEYADIHDKVPRGPGPHLLTGPIAVRGAEAGDALKIEILDVRLRDDWGFNCIKPLLGALPDATDELRRIHLPIDRSRQIVHTPWQIDIPAQPFFGIMGTAPPRSWGRQSSVVPRAFGGNIDNKLLTSGGTLYLPVFESGALFSIGDGHAAQGDGEVCLTAVETGLTGRFRIELLKCAHLSAPRAETAAEYISMAFHEDLDEAARNALRAMIEWIVETSDLTFEDAYRLCSLVADLRVTQLVNQHKGVHMTLPKWTGLIGRRG